MGNFNRIISFVLGLIVVIVFLAVITGRLNLRNRISGGGQAKTTPTPIPTLRYTQPTTLVVPTTNTYSPNIAKKPTSIPATGSPTVFLPILLSGLSAGLFLKRRGKS